MQYVRVARIVEDGRPKGYELNPEPYLVTLGELARRLPAGARTFATDESHYDFFGSRCVKDLRLVELGEAHEREGHLRFDPSPWKHQCGLTLTYRGLATMVFEPSDEGSGYGSVLLDELLPLDDGLVSHEVALTGGTLRVVADDLTASWQ